MRQLTGREKAVIVVFAALAVLAAASIYMSPSEGTDPETVLAYYVDTFTRAQEVTIRSAAEDMEPITVTREEATGLFSRLAMAARYAGVSQHPSPQPPKWILDVFKEDGSRVGNIRVGLHLEAPKQPGRGKLWVIPRSPGQREPAPVMVEIIDSYVGSSQPKPSGGSAE